MAQSYICTTDLLHNMLEKRILIVAVLNVVTLAKHIPLNHNLDLVGYVIPGVPGAEKFKVCLPYGQYNMIKSPVCGTI